MTQGRSLFVQTVGPYSGIWFWSAVFLQPPPEDRPQDLKGILAMDHLMVTKDILGPVSIHGHVLGFHKQRK